MIKDFWTEEEIEFEGDDTYQILSGNKPKPDENMFE